MHDPSIPGVLWVIKSEKDQGLYFIFLPHFLKSLISIFLVLIFCCFSRLIVCPHPPHTLTGTHLSTEWTDVYICLLSHSFFIFHLSAVSLLFQKQVCLKWVRDADRDVSCIYIDLQNTQTVTILWLSSCPVYDALWSSLNMCNLWNKTTNLCYKFWSTVRCQIKLS